MTANRALLLSVAVLVAAVLIQGVAPTPLAALSAAEMTYTVKLKKGVSNTYFGDAFKFTGTGTMTVDSAAGTFSYSLDLSNGLTFEGSGLLTRTTGEDVYAVADSASGSIAGSVIFTGKLKQDGRKFTKGRLYAATPNRLGNGIEGFVYSTAKLTGTRQ